MRTPGGVHVCVHMDVCVCVCAATPSLHNGSRTGTTEEAAKRCWAPASVCLLLEGAAGPLLTP